MERAKDKKLYQSVKDKADKIYKRPGLYKSVYIQKEIPKTRWHIYRTKT